MLTDKERAEFRNLTQNTPEWLVCRKGRITASRCDALVRRLKNGNYSADRTNYLWELVVEHLSGRATDRYVTQEMEWGIEQQPFAEAAYEMKTGVTVEPIGLVVHPEMDYFAASPDGLLDDDGLIEIKCPTTRTHLEWLKAGDIPEEYIPQMTAQMACMPERQYCDFVSFDPRLPFGMQLFIRRYHRDKERIAQMEQEVAKFSGELAFVLMELSGARPVVTELEASIGKD